MPQPQQPSDLPLHIPLSIFLINLRVDDYFNAKEMLESALLAIPSKQHKAFLEQEDAQGLTPLMLFFSLRIDDNLDSDRSWKSWNAYNSLLTTLLLAGADFDYVAESGKNITQICSWMFNEDNIRKLFVKTAIKYIITENFPDYLKAYENISIAWQTMQDNSYATPHGLQMTINYFINAPIADLQELELGDNDFALIFRTSILEIMHDPKNLHSLYNFDKLMAKFINQPPLFLNQASAIEKIINEFFHYYSLKNNAGQEFDGFRAAYLASLKAFQNLPQETKDKLKTFLRTNFERYVNTDAYLAYESLMIHLNMQDELKELDEKEDNHDDLEAKLLDTYSFVIARSGNEITFEKPQGENLILFLARAIDFKAWDILNKFIGDLGTLSDLDLKENPFAERELANLNNKMLSAVPLEQLDDLIPALHEIASSFNDKTSNTFKEEIYFTILGLESIQNQATDIHIQEAVLQNLSLIESIMLAEHIYLPMMRQLIPTIEILDNSVAAELFSKLLENNPELFFKMLEDDQIDNKLQCQYIIDNFGKIINSPQFSANEDNLFTTLQQYLSVTKQKIHYAKIVPYTKNFLTLQKIVEYKLVSIPNPEEPIIRNNNTVNPILIAAANQNVDLFVSLYKNRNQEPWKTYWIHAGDSENILIKFLLIMPLPNSGITREKTAEILLHALQIKSVIANLSGKHLRNTIPAYLHEHNNWNYNLKFLLATVKNPTSERNGIKKLLKRFLNLEKILAEQSDASLKLAAPLQSNNAHDNRVQKDANSIFIKDFDAALKARYPNSTNKEEQIKQAFIDIRLLVIKNLIEYVVVDVQDEKIRDQIIKECDLQDYFEFFTAQKQAGLNVSFVEFKEFIKNNAPLLQTVNPPENTDSKLSSYLKNLKINTAYAQRCRLSWNPFSPKPEMYAKAFGYNHALLDDTPCREFALFNMLLATEDVRTTIEAIPENNYELLYTFAKNDTIKDPEYQAARNLIQSKILNENIDPNSDLTWDQLKTILIKNMLFAQNSLSNSFVASIYECMVAKSCAAGVFTRFSTAILSNYHKYTGNLLNIRSHDIQDIMFDKFKSKLEAQIVSLILKRIRPKQSRFFFMRGSNKQKNSTTQELDKFINTIFNPEPKTLDELASKINAISDLTTRSQIVNTLFPTLKAQDIQHGSEIIANDKEIAALFDAFFTVTTNNFAELFAESKSILKYSAFFKKITTAEDSILLENFDKQTGRAKFLASCFDSSTINKDIYQQIKTKDKMAEPLSTYENALIKYYSVAIAESVNLEELASAFLNNLKLIFNSKKPSRVEAIIITENTTVNDLKDKLQSFFILLKTLNIEANSQYERQIKDSLNQAIEAQYSLPFAKRNSDFELNVFEYEEKLNTAEIDLIEDCKKIAKFLTSHEQLREAYSKGFENLQDFIKEIAYHSQTEGNNEVYDSCRNAARAIQIDGYWEDKDTWNNTWDTSLQRTRDDYNLL